MSDNLRFQEEENSEIREHLREQRSMLIQAQIDKEMEQISNNLRDRDLAAIESTNESSSRELFDLQIDLDSTKWKLEMTKAEKF